jgi:hypothetical protein
MKIVKIVELKAKVEVQQTLINLLEAQVTELTKTLRTELSDSVTGQIVKLKSKL